jgi:phage baseplate assembly protein W
VSEPEDFAAPFKFDSVGEAETIVQGTQADILASVLNICECPEGFRDDLPEFGIPQLEFQTVPLQLQALEEAVVRWEPEATLTIIEHALEEAGTRQITMEVG